VVLAKDSQNGRLITGYRFAYSKEQCIRAARASLRMMSDNNGTAAFLEKWWIPLFYGASTFLASLRRLR
jgi:hypothetical protein